MLKEHAEELTETTYGEYTMNAIEQTLNKLGELKKLTESVKNLTFSCDEKGKADIEQVNETTRKEVYELAETLNQEHHGKLIIALAASHAAKYGEQVLPEKVRSWLQEHEWVRTLILILLALAAAWGLNSCASSVKQIQPDGSSTERTIILDGSTVQGLIRLYGIPEIPTVNHTK